MGMFDSVTDAVGGLLGSGSGVSLEDPRDAAAKVKAVKADAATQYDQVKVANAAGPQAAQLNTSQSDQARQYQANLMNQLAQQSQGNGPSLAGMQLKQAQEQAFAQQQAQLASNRGQFNPGAARQALQNNMQANQSLGNQAAQARTQEQLNAQNQLAGVSNSVRGQDINQANAQAGFQQQAGLAGYQGQLQQNSQQAQLDQARAQQFYANEADRNKAFADQQYQTNKLGYDAVLANNQQMMAKQQMNDAKSSAGLGAIAGLASTAMMFSDKNLKKDIKPADDKLTKFLDAINGYSYKYKDESMGKGEHISPMAQDLEKSEIGKNLVQDTEHGKMVDYGKGLGAMLAAMGHIHDRLKKIEGK